MATKTGITVLDTRVPLQRYRDPLTNKDLVAVFHNDYRHVWVQTLPSTRYAHTRVRGAETHDQTCYYAPHHHAGGKRTQWPAVIFTYLPNTGLKSGGKPGFLITPEGWLVIDLNFKPVLNYRAPLTLSSKAATRESAWLLEAIVRENYDFGMQVQDMRARMPGVLNSQGKDSMRTATISMMMHRFRLQAPCISWSSKGGDAFRDYLDVLLPKACLDSNSTASFRTLHKHEIEEMVLLNVGSSPCKARPANRGTSNGPKLWDDAVKKYQKARLAYDGKSDFTDTYRQVQAIREVRNRRNSATSEGINLPNSAAPSEGKPDSDDSDAYDSSDSDDEYRDIALVPKRFGREGFPQNVQQMPPPFVPPFDGNYTQYLANEHLGPDLPGVHFNTHFGGRAPELLSFAGSPEVDMEDMGQPPSDTQTVIDFLNLQPASGVQMELIRTFLEPTRTQFIYVTDGEIPPDTDETNTYLKQWKQIDQAMIDWLKINGAEGEVFTLLRLEEFTDTKISWNGPWYSEIFGEEIDPQLVEYLVEMAKVEIGK